MAASKPGYINSYVGFPSFFGAPIIGREDVKEGMTVVAGVPIDEGINIGRKGARFGPRGIREGTYKYRDGAGDGGRPYDGRPGQRHGIPVQGGWAAGGYRGPGHIATGHNGDDGGGGVGGERYRASGRAAGDPGRRPLRVLSGFSRVCEGNVGEAVEPSNPGICTSTATPTSGTSSRRGAVTTTAPRRGG